MIIATLLIKTRKTVGDDAVALNEGDGIKLNVKLRSKSSIVLYSTM